MPLRSPLRTARNRSGRRLAVVVLALLLAGTAAGALLLDHPAAQAGVGDRDWAAFSTVTDADGAYTVEVRQSTATANGTRGVVVRHGRFANGSFVASVAPADPDGSLRGSPVVRREVAQLDGVRYERETYRTVAEAETLEPDVYADGRGHVVAREDPDTGSGARAFALGVERVLARQGYARAGTGTRGGTTFARYDVLGAEDVLDRLVGSGGVTGYVLVDRRDRVRYANLRSRDDPETVVEYRADPGDTPTVPPWVSTARENLHSSASRPSVDAYRHGAGVVLVSADQWIPSRETTVAVLFQSRDAPPATAAIPAGEPAFRRAGPDAYVAVLAPTPDGSLAVRSSNRTGNPPARNASPGRVILDRSGRNLYDLPVRPASRLGSVYSITAAHLRPANGGGRALRVDDLEFGDAVPPDAPVTITVGNGTASRSLTVSAGALSSDRFYLLRTAEGIEVRNAGGIAAHVSPSTRYADRRFVASARVEIAVWGVPVVDRAVPRRATQASETPRSRLLTGVAIATYDEPPDGSLLGRGPELRAMNWSGYTFVEVHSWDYDALYVSGGTSIFHPDVVREDSTNYYRAADGTTFRVETANGTLLYRGRANGTAVVSP